MNDKFCLKRLELEIQNPGLTVKGFFFVITICCVGPFFRKSQMEWQKNIWFVTLQSCLKSYGVSGKKHNSQIMT